MATAVPAYEERRMSVGRVFQRAFSTTLHNPIVVVGLALVLGAAPSVLFSYVTRSVVADRLANGGSQSVIWGAILFSWLVGIAIYTVLQGALTRATVAENEGQVASFGDCIAAGLRVFLPLIGVGLIYAIAIGIGWFLLIVPGILVMIIWSVAAPALVVEREGVMASLSRSSELTKGSRWKILGLFLVLLVIYLLVSMALGLVGLAANPAATAPFGVVNLIATAITALVFNLLWGTIQPSLYVELRQAKEGDSADHLAQVFA